MRRLYPKLRLLFLLVATPLILGKSTVAFSMQKRSIADVPMLAQTVEERKAEGDRLLSEGVQFWQTSQYKAALDNLQQALVIYREIGDRTGEGVTLLALGSVYDSLGQYQQEIEFYQKVLVISQEVGDREMEGLTLTGLGLVYKNLGQYKQALEFYQQALAIAREVGDRSWEGKTLGNLGLVYDNLGQYQKALEFSQQALAIIREVGDRAGEGTTLNNLGLVYDNLGQYQKALEFFQQALDIHREVGVRAEEGRTLNNLGLVYNNLGQYKQALEFYQQALAIKREVSDRSGEGTTLNNLGAVYGNLGQYPQALEFYQQALAIAREVGVRAGEGATLHGLGLVYKNLGQYKQALEFYQQALAIRREVGDRSGEGTTLNNLGVVYDNLGHYQKALEFYQQALAIKREIGDRAGEGATLTNVGTVYLDIGQHQQAIEFYQQALGIAQEVGDRFGEGTTLNNLGGVYSSLGQYPQALEFYQQALAIAREVDDRSGEGTTLTNVGIVYNSLGQYVEAERYLFDSIAALESLRSPELSDEDKISFFDTQSLTYRLLQQAFIAQNQTEKALEISERGRARAFVERMARRSHGDSAEEFVPPPPPTLAEIQQVAREQNATLVEYSIMADELLYIWVIHPTGEIDFRQVNPKTINPRFAINNWVDETFFAMGINRSSDATEPEILQARALTNSGLPELHKILIEPIADLLPKTPEERVIFVPHGELFLVPFPALKDASGTHLIDKHTILTAPAIQVLQLTRQAKRVGRTEGEVLVVGNPTMPTQSAWGEQLYLRSLPGSAEEAQEIAQMLGTQPLIGSAATETAVVERMKTARIIHLATHGILDDDRGIGSSIALTPTNSDTVAIPPNPNDGFLMAEEILGLNLNADLVVLSACDTGRGKITGDGVVGLSRSLLTAGVSSVVVSLWQVPDRSTAQLMVLFYQNLQQGLDKATALRNAMLEMKKTHPDPIHWAAFALMGEIE